MKPHEIEKRSFEIIDTEAGHHNFSDQEWSIIRRMIHTSADFEYKNTVRFHPNAIQSGIQAIQQGKAIITDTEMAKAGIRRGDLSNFGNDLLCLIRDETIAKDATDKGITRSAAAVDAALPFINGGIYVIGNAPTALMRLIALISEGKVDPALIIGFPVGFVNAAESKEKLRQVVDKPFITNIGRKGGSNIAASVVNALIKLAL